MRWCTVNEVGRITSIGLFPDTDEGITINGIADTVIAPVPDEVMPETHYYRDGEFVEFGVQPTPWHVWDWDTYAWRIDLDAARIDIAERISGECQNTILAGFKSSALGAEHLYPTKLTDQQNLASSVLSSLMPGLPEGWTTPFWCMDENGVWEFRPHSSAQIQQAGLEVKAAILACQAKNEQLQAQIAAATSIDQLEEITWI